MSLFANREEHTANPPDTWQVVKVAERHWQVRTADGAVLDAKHTKREAETLKVEGFYVRLYDIETRWYAGEPVSGWKPYEGLVTR